MRQHQRVWEGELLVPCSATAKLDEFPQFPLLRFAFLRHTRKYPARP